MVAPLRSQTAVPEVLAVTVLPGHRCPDPIVDVERLPENSFMVPIAASADVPAAVRPPARDRTAPHGVSVRP